VGECVHIFRRACEKVAIDVPAKDVPFVGFVRDKGVVVNYLHMRVCRNAMLQRKRYLEWV
jgi:hypothetical protein